MSCVECLSGMDCPASRPVCTAENTCAECVAHTDCPDSGLCLLEGECASPEDVAYVGGSNAADRMMCLKDAPCENLNQALKGMALRRYIKITGPVTDDMTPIIDGETVDIYGDAGAMLNRSTSGPGLEIRKDARVTLVDLEIIGSSDGNAVELKYTPEPVVSMTRVKVIAPSGNGILITDGMLTMSDSEVRGSSLAGVRLERGALVLTGSRVIDNAANGVHVNGGTLEIRRSSITENRGTAGVLTTGASMVTIDSTVIAANTGISGGASITGPFSIKNSIIAANGNAATSGVGGLTLQPMLAENGQFEFNTVVENQSTAGVGISCTIPFAISNSILTGNAVSGCTDISYSLTALSGEPGGTNKGGDPMFLSRSLGNPMFYRIGATSAARDSANPAATLDVDIDGQMRSDARKDMGADEYQ